MQIAFHQVTPVPLPPGCGVADTYPSLNLADAFAIALPAGASTDPEQLARFLFAQQPRWVRGLMALRDAIVAMFGLKTAKQLNLTEGAGGPGRVGIFKVYAKGAAEIVLGEDDKHLDFRVSVLCAGQPAQGAQRQLIVSTVVHCHNRLGRFYIFVIAPFHRMIIQASLRRAARIGWPAQTHE